VAAVPRLEAGRRLGAFEIGPLLGAGGMGEVYRARDTRLDRAVAIKVLSAEIVRDPESRGRFEREARVISQLVHPHICTIHDIGTATIDGNDVQFLVMELVEGETLAARLTRGPLPVEQCLNVARETADALATAHSRGVIHRDLKPSNIMLTKSGVKLLDFGLARSHRMRGNSDSQPAVLDEPITRTGFVLGTLAYMAPEQIRGLEADGRSDLFAFGAVLYEMLTGRRPFGGDSPVDRAAAILEHQPRPIRTQQPLVPASLERLVTTCLAKDPDERWQHAHDVSLALQEIARRGAEPDVPFEPGGSRWRLHTAWAAVVLVSTLLLWILRPGANEATAPPPNPRPVVVMMDSPLPGRVYDARTQAAGGTNADDVSDALRGLPLLTHKENTSATWHREEQVRQQNPDLVISHLSCLLDMRAAHGEAALEDQLFDVAQLRLTMLMGYLGAANPRTKFLVYSRGRIWQTAEAEASWARDVVARFPILKGRVFTLKVPGRDTATFRNDETADLLRRTVKQILSLP
jgi:tRNA A-37 threonylcarbamoyl transferase component Bud32